MKHKIQASIALLLMIVLAGCSGGGGGGGTTNTPPTVSTPGSVENIVLDPTAIQQPDFTRITSADPVTHFLNFRNIGDGVISPITLRLAGPDASFFSLQTPTCPDLQPQSANVCTVRIGFNPAGKINRIYLGQIEINGLVFPFSTELAVRNTGRPDYQVYQGEEYVSETIDLGKTSGTTVLKQKVLLRHLMKQATGNLQLVMTSPNFTLDRTSCPAPEINATGCPIEVSFNPEGKAKRVYTAPINIGNQITLNLRAENTETAKAPEYQFLNEENEVISLHDFGAITVPDKKATTIKIKNIGQAAGSPTLAIMPNQVFIVTDNTCEGKTLAPDEDCSLTIRVKSSNRLANKYASKLIAENNSIDLKAFVYNPSSCAINSHVDPDSLTCVSDLQTQIVSNGTRTREWVLNPQPGVWSDWIYSCSQPSYELNESGDACIFKQRRLTLTVEGNGQIVGGESKLYNFGTVVTLKAVPDQFNAFQGWEGDSCSGSVITCTVTMNQVHNVKAVFFVPPLQISPNPINLYQGSSQQITVAGGIPPYRYALKEDALGSISATGLYSGYSGSTQGAVEVKDSQNRVVNVSLKVVPPVSSPSGVFNVTTDSVSNLGVTGGLEPYTFTKNSGVGTGGVGGYETGDTPGTAFVTVTDGLGTIKNVNINVVRPLKVTPSSFAIEINKTLTLSYTNGIPPYIASIQPGGRGILSTNIFSAGNTPGQSIIKVKDGMGSEVIVNGQVVDLFRVPTTSFKMLINSSKTIEVSGGLEPYNFTKVSGPGTLTEDGVFTAFGDAGTTVVTVSDQLGSSREVTFNIYYPLSLGFTNHKMEVNKIKQITPTGGATPYSISLKSGSGTLSGTQYTSSLPTSAVVEVSDSMGNKVSGTIDVLPEFKLGKYQHNMLANEGYQIVATGGLTPYTYQLVSGGKGSVNAQGIYTAPNEVANDTVEVTDGLGTVKRIDIRSFMPLVATTTTPEIYVSQTASIVASDGLAPYTFRVSKGLGTVSPSGIYTASTTSTNAEIEVVDAMLNKKVVAINVFTSFNASPLSKNLVVGQTQQVGTSGGKTPYQYRIVSGPGTINSTGLYAGTAAGDAEIEVKDSLTTVKTLNFKVVEPLTISPVTHTMLAGQTLQLTTTNGLPPYSYDLMQGLGSVTQSGLFSAATIAETVKVRVTDTMNNTAISTVQVVLPLTVTNESFITTVQKITQISASGGLTPYTYSIVSGGGSINSTGSYTAPTTPGNAVIKVADSFNQEKLISVEIKEALVLVPQQAYIEVNQTKQYSATGGLGPYSYRVLSGRGTINSSSGLYSSGTTSGEAVLQVTDSLNNTSEASIQILDVLQISPSSFYVSYNATQQLTASGGLGPYTFVMESGAGTVSASGLYTAPASSGTAQIKLTDSLGTTTNATANIVPPLNLTPVGSSVTVNKTRQFTASGGVPPYTYSVISGSINSSGLYTAGSVTGSQTIRVKDSVDTEKTVSVNVVPDLTLLVASNIGLLINQNYAILVTGGLEPYTYTVTSGSGSVDTMGTYTAPPAPSTDVVTISDSLGNSKTVTFKSVEMLSVSPNVINIVAGQSRTINPTLGQTPYTYTFSQTNGNFNSGTRVYTAGASAGTATILVKDAINNQVTVNINVFTSLQLTLAASTVQSGSRAAFSVVGGSGNITVELMQDANIGSYVRDGFYYAGYTATNVTEQIRITDNVTGEVKTSPIINITAMPTTLQKVGTAIPSSNRGSALAHNSSYLVVGAPDESNQGLVQIYSRSSNQWVTPVEMTSPQAQSKFGASVDIQGSIIAVGSPLYDGSQADNGRVYLYQFDGSNWVLDQTIDSPVEQANEQFGKKVSLFTAAGIQYLAVSSKSSTNGVDSGSVYLFRQSGSAWNLERTINGTAGDQLGYSIKGNNGHLIIGVPFRDYSSKTDVGEVVVLVHNGTTFEDNLIRPSDAPNNGQYGLSVSVDPQGRIAVGAPNRATPVVSAGSVYAYYKQTNRTYTGEKIVVDPFELPSGRFGKHVEILEDYLMASNEKVEGVTVFDYKNNYVYLRAIRGNSTQLSQQFAHSFSASSLGVVAGVNQTGEVFMYNWALEPTWPKGVDGDLVITSGQTIQLSPGSVKDYKSIRIDAGGVLEINSGSAWTVIGVKENLIINGEIRAKKGEHTGGSFSITVPDRMGSAAGEVLSCSIPQSSGGNGGNSRKNSYGGGGQNSGLGGGGAGDDGGGGGASVSVAGAGGPTSGGAGASTYNQSGNSASSRGGGGGGYRGRHGQALYIKVKGNISGTGRIDVSGENGRNGGNGAGYPENYTYQCNPHTVCYASDPKLGCTDSRTEYDTCTGTHQWGGGGGGGGAGGSGGKLSLRVRQEQAGTLSILTGPGSGGAGGVGGNSAGSGGAGGNGAAGVSDISSGTF